MAKTQSTGRRNRAAGCGIGQNRSGVCTRLSPGRQGEHAGAHRSNRKDAGAAPPSHAPATIVATFIYERAAAEADLAPALARAPSILSIATNANAHARKAALWAAMLSASS